MLRRWVTPGVFVALAVIGVACESSPTATLNPGPLGDSQEADALRQLAFAYWEAFNAYDADRALGYLEEDYRQQRDGTVRGEIEKDQALSRKAGVERGDLSMDSRPRRKGNVFDHEGAPGKATHSHGLPGGSGGVEDHICRGGKVTCSMPNRHDKFRYSWAAVLNRVGDGRTGSLG